MALAYISGTPLRLIFILCLSLQHTQAIDDYYLDDYNYYEDYSDYSGPTAAGMQWEKFSKEEGQIDWLMMWLDKSNLCIWSIIHFLFSTVFENDRKSLIQHCERSELRYLNTFSVLRM